MIKGKVSQKKLNTHRQPIKKVKIENNHSFDNKAMWPKVIANTNSFVNFEH